MLSHDLRSHLANIIEAANLLSESAPNDGNIDSSNWLEIITRSSKKMTRLMESILALARSSHVQLSKDIIDMNRLVKEMVEDLCELTANKGVNWDIRELPPAKGDWLLIEIVWRNLISNAIKFSSHQESQKIEIGSIEHGHSEITYYIRDNGMGFSEEFKPKLFKSFEREQSTSEIAGSGVGLANCKQIINRHGGRIWAEKNPDGVGSIFYFTLST